MGIQPRQGGERKTETGSGLGGGQQKGVAVLPELLHVDLKQQIICQALAVADSVLGPWEPVGIVTESPASRPP